MILPKTASDAPKTLTKTNREKLYRRQHGLCPWCGNPLLSERAEDMSAHHRLLRSAGGTWRLSNIVGLHPECHNVQPRSVHQEPSRAYGLGFMIRAGRMTGLELPVYDKASQQWKHADDAGDWADCPPAVAAELLAAAGALRNEVA